VAAAAERAARVNSRRAFDAMANDERIDLDGWLPTVSAAASSPSIQKESD
jgi:hypothetical protein